MENRLKVFILFAAVSIICVSCSERKDVQISDDINIGMLLHRVDSINSYFIQVYETSNNQCALKRVALEADTAQQQANNQDVLKADAIGFFAGGTLGTGTGIVIGSFFCPGTGTVVGAVSDFIASGIAHAVLCSVVAARNSNWIALQETESSWDIEEWIHHDNEILFEDEIIGGNIGWYHNDIIQNIWNNSMYYLSGESLLDHIIIYTEDSHMIEYENRGLFFSVLQEQWPYMPDDFRNHVNVDYQQIIEEFMITIAQISEDARFDYTRSIMEEISQFGLEEEDIYLLNGTISTYYYSSQLWNIKAVLNFPREN